MTQPKHAQLDLLLSISDGLSRGSDEMLRVSPTDAMHPPSCSLAIRDAVEELKWLRAEIERLRVENEELRKERNTADAHLFPLKFHFGNCKIYNVTYAKERKIEELRAETKRLRSNLEGKP